MITCIIPTNHSSDRQKTGANLKNFGCGKILYGGGEMCEGGITVCRDRGCRYYTKFKEINNCVLCVDKEYTMQEIADCEHISRQRIDQIEKRALRKLRKKWGPRLRVSVG